MARLSAFVLVISEFVQLITDTASGFSRVLIGNGHQCRWGSPKSEAVGVKWKCTLGCHLIQLSNVKFLARICPDEAIHEFEELDATTALTSPVATSKAGNKVDVPRITLGRRLLQKRCSLLFIARLLIRVPLFFHASKFMIGKSPPPIADNSGRIRL